MNRLTIKNPFGYNNYKGIDITTTMECINKLGQLEDIEEELGVDLIQFLKAAKYTLDNSSMTECKMPDGIVIRTDYGYVEDWLDEIKKYLEEK